MTRERLCKVLIADPDAAARRELRGHLEHHGYHVEAAANAVDAIRVGLALRPHVVVAERHLAEDTSGLAVIEALERHVEGLEAIVTTAEPIEELREQSARLARVEIAAKPIGINALGELIDTLYERARAARGE